MNEAKRVDLYKLSSPSKEAVQARENAVAAQVKRLGAKYLLAKPIERKLS